MKPNTKCEEVTIHKKLFGLRDVVKYPVILTLVELAVWDRAELPLDLVCNWKHWGCKRKEKNLKKVKKQKSNWRLVKIWEKNTLRTKFCLHFWFDPLAGHSHPWYSSGNVNNKLGSWVNLRQPLQNPLPSRFNYTYLPGGHTVCSTVPCLAINPCSSREEKNLKGWKPQQS